MRLGSIAQEGSRNGVRMFFRPKPSGALHHRPRTARCTAIGPGGDKGPKEALKKLAQEAEQRAHHLIDCLTPKQEYDLADVTLIFFSTMVFMWLAAGLYRVYVYTYYFSDHQHAISTLWGH